MKNENNHFELIIPSNSAYLEKVEKLCVKVGKKAGLNESDQDDLCIVVTEIVNNAIHHGNRDDAHKQVDIIFEIGQNTIEIRIKDQGTGFDPGNLKDPLAPENLLKESGRGIFLIKNLMDSIEFNFKPDGTEVVVKKIFA